MLTLSSSLGGYSVCLGRQGWGQQAWREVRPCWASGQRPARAPGHQEQEASLGATYTGLVLPFADGKLSPRGARGLSQVTRPVSGQTPVLSVKHPGPSAGPQPPYATARLPSSEPQRQDPPSPSVSRLLSALTSVPSKSPFTHAHAHGHDGASGGRGRAHNLCREARKVKQPVPGRPGVQPRPSSSPRTPRPLLTSAAPQRMKLSLTHSVLPLTPANPDVENGRG